MSKTIWRATVNAEEVLHYTGCTPDEWHIDIEADTLEECLKKLYDELPTDKHGNVERSYIDFFRLEKLTILESLTQESVLDMLKHKCIDKEFQKLSLHKQSEENKLNDLYSEGYQLDRDAERIRKNITETLEWIGRYSVDLQANNKSSLTEYYTKQMNQYLTEHSKLKEEIKQVFDRKDAIEKEKKELEVEIKKLEKLLKNYRRQ